jgi:hypothetical protein
VSGEENNNSPALKLLHALFGLGLPERNGPEAFEVIRLAFEDAKVEGAALIGKKLCVKALAGALGVSVRYVYAMRSCGFKMNGITRSNQTATYAEAVTWINQNEFRMKDGKGKCKKVQKR